MRGEERVPRHRRQPKPAEIEDVQELKAAVEALLGADRSVEAFETKLLEVLTRAAQEILAESRGRPRKARGR